MKNPLTLEERATAKGLLSHDSRSIASVLIGRESLKEIGRGLKSEYEKALKRYLNAVHASIYLLNSDQIPFPSAILPYQLLTELEVIQTIISEREGKLDVNYPLGFYQKFTTHVPLIVTALFNLCENSSRFIDSRAGHISMAFSRFSGEVPDAVYVPDQTPAKGEFVRFEVKDNGRGFDSYIPKNFFRLGCSTRTGGGFGLYYVYLVCKFLGGNIGINSKRGDTRIALYQSLS